MLPSDRSYTAAMPQSLPLVLNILAPRSLRRRLHAGSGVGRAGLLLLFYAAAGRFFDPRHPMFVALSHLPASLVRPSFAPPLRPSPPRLRPPPPLSPPLLSPPPPLL